MERLTAAEIYEKQSRRLSDAVPDIQRGVQRVTESPTARAAEFLDKAKANYAAAIDSGKTRDALMSVTLQDWQQKTIAKADRIPQGIVEAKDKVIAFHNQRADYQKTIDSALAKKPNRTPSDAEQRMLIQMREMSKFRFRKGAR